MGFSAKIIADSINPSGSRLTTVELTYPRCIHSEFMTHRMFSRNAASSRAIPVEKMIKAIEEEPFIPIHWGVNQKGMQADKELPLEDRLACEDTWLKARNHALRHVRTMMNQGLHKQIANRILEPWMWITVICTGNQNAYENFFKLRCHKDAEPHIQKIAFMLRKIYDERERSSVTQLRWGRLHVPLTGFDGDELLTEEDLKKVSVARCARVSYLTHEGRRDVQADIALHDRLAASGHWSPFEHVAAAGACWSEKASGNFGKGWLQYRKEFANEMCRNAPR